MVSLNPIIEIEYCIGCRWLTRASWVAQELLITFESDLHGITLIPSSESGTFRLKIGSNIIWDRKTMGGFPELKELKQLIRDSIVPEKDLGHSDFKEKN
jgi:selenoprotein W-related protein